MKIQIDTIQKTIRVEEDVNLGELQTWLCERLPDWKEYKLVTYYVNWTYHPAAPFIQPLPLSPATPAWPFTITCAGDGETYNIN